MFQANTHDLIEITSMISVRVATYGRPPLRTAADLWARGCWGETAPGPLRMPAVLRRNPD